MSLSIVVPITRPKALLHPNWVMVPPYLDDAAMTTMMPTIAISIAIVYINSKPNLIVRVSVVMTSTPIHRMVVARLLHACTVRNVMTFMHLAIVLTVGRTDHSSWACRNCICRTRGHECSGHEYGTESNRRKD